ncbi:50S ribosomal protein L15e [Candidatus Micrarchaeota archaeon]|nr:MAG: 50S ribosomal protein L15e [Candidatus Micrarchaeota archaeon]
MGASKLISETFKREYSGKDKELKELYRQKLIEWRKQPAQVRVEKPTNPVRARRLGYKAKQGIIVVRVRVKKGSGHITRPNAKRRPHRMGVNKRKRAKSLQRIAEERVQRKHMNMEVINSYWVGEDGQHKWYEVILVDPNHPQIKNDKDLNKIANRKHAVFRKR